MKRILVAGLGNIFHGDDAFGVEVACALAGRALPEQVVVEDFGIRAYDLAYALTDSYDAVILVDTVARGQAPGTVSLIEPDAGPSFRVPASGCSEPAGTLKGGHQTPVEVEQEAVDAHTMNPVAVLRMAQSLGGVNGKLFLVGCEPAVLECEGGQFGLSEVVRAAVATAVALIESLAHSLLSETQHTNAGCVPA